MNTTITRIDYAAACERLASITTDAGALAGLERISETGEINDAFMDVVVREDISLDWLLLGKGEPHIAREGVS